VSRDYPHRGLGHRRLEVEVIRLHEWRRGESSVLWGLTDVISGYRHSRTVWGPQESAGRQVAEIERSRELGSSQSEGPRVGCSKSRSHEERRQPLDPGQGRTVGSGTPSPIAHSGVERGHFRLKKSRNAESRGSCGHVAEP
jgi:hypothetical protein